jgi:SAM-dependent methyltransferase
VSTQYIQTALKILLVLVGVSMMITQCRKPSGWLGRRVARAMNVGHAGLAKWGLSHITIGREFTMLDVGCGGGKLIDTLAACAPHGMIFGIDYSSSSVETARATNAARIADGSVDIQLGTVSRLPFESNTFDVVTAFETHYYWPDLPRDLREIRRVLKPGGVFLLVAEVHRGQRLSWLFGPAMRMLGGRYLTAVEHRDLVIDAGYVDVVIDAQPSGWLSVRGVNPGVARSA